MMYSLLLLFMVPAADMEALSLGARLEPFVDRALIESLDDVELRMHVPAPGEIVLRFDKPWEGRYAGYVTVLRDGDLYRMYYRGLPEARSDGSGLETTCYAESRDGVHWEKPNLGIHEVSGTRDNNCVLADAAPYSSNFSPFLDTRPGVPADERFKALAGAKRGGGLAAFASGDGLHWRKLRDAPVITQGALDSQNVSFWSEAEQTYVCYLRTFTAGPDGSKGFRTVSRCTSSDFIEWTDIVEMDFGDTPREHLYTSQTHPYFRAPHIYIALAARYVPGRQALSEETLAAIGAEAGFRSDSSETVLMTSRGGARYDRTFMEGFVRPGLEPGAWTSRTNYAALGVVPTGANEMSLYIHRNYGQTSAHLQRMVLRTDGFASLHGGYDGGEAGTKPLVFDGKTLELNVATSAAGSVRVEFQSVDGEALEGFALDDCDEIFGDSLARAVSWNGSSDLSALRGTAVRMRIHLKDADLYAIRFAP